MRYQVVLPFVYPAYMRECVKGCELDNVLLVDNTVANRGIMRSHNLGLTLAYQRDFEWFIVLSAAIRFGRRGGLDFIENLETYGEQHSIISARHAYGWHLIAFHRRVIDAIGQWDEHFCVDDQTEALTADGWKRYGALVVGEQVLTLSPDTGCAEWAPIERVNVWPVADHRMVRMQGKAHSSLTTPNHRWLVERNVQHVRGPGGYARRREFIDTEHLQTRDRIACAAPLSNAPTEPKYTDAFVELAAWYWTEGHDVAGTSTGVTISQSERVNSEYTARIRATLVALFGPPSSSLRVGRNKRAMWREDTRSDRMVTFRLSRLACLELKTVVRGVDKVVTPAFLAALTPSQIRLFIDVSICADGSTEMKPSGVERRRISQAVKVRLDSFQMACTLAGINSVMTGELTPRAKFNPAGTYRKWTLSLLEGRPYVNPRHAEEHARTGPGIFSITDEQYTGVIWCPTTRNGTWLARRDGTVYFTGNSPYGYDDVDFAIRAYKAAIALGDPYIGKWGAWPCDIDDAGMAHSLAKAGVKVDNEHHLAYLRAKWGRQHGGEWDEYWDRPFGDKPFNYWPDVKFGFMPTGRHDVLPALDEMTDDHVLLDCAPYRGEGWTVLP